ncbi:MAG: hypothetical protein MZV65_44155 [Chromatiales bacterium]|nr:hypothetical protein [Chromatiales bacterium]
MLDFYADWCVSCKEMEKFTFADAQVASAHGRRCCCCRRTSPATRTRTRQLLKRFKPVRPAGHHFLRPVRQRDRRTARDRLPAGGQVRCSPWSRC